MPFFLTWGASLLTLDTPLPQLPKPNGWNRIAPVETKEPALNGHRLITGLEGWRAEFGQMRHATYYKFVLLSGGRGSPSRDGYIRLPVFDDENATVTWIDCSCVIHAPKSAQQGPLWDLRTGVVIDITDLDYVRDAV